MAIQREGTVAVGNSGAATTYAAPLPADIAAGEVLALWVATKGFASTFPTASGWDRRIRKDATQDLALFTRVADGSEGSTITVDNGASSQTWATICQRYSGVDTTSLLDATAVDANGSGTSTSDLSVTTATDGAMLIAAIAIDDPGNANRTPTVGGTASATEVGQNLTNQVLEADDVIQATAGASGTVNWSWGNTDTYSAAMVALKPAAGGGGGATGHTRMALTGVG